MLGLADDHRPDTITAGINLFLNLFYYGVFVMVTMISVEIFSFISVIIFASVSHI